jgi:hypothetical protein
MQRIAGSLSERLSFLVAATVAGITTSVLPCLLFPSSPLCSGANNLLSYAGEHFSLSIGLWILAFAASWIFAGPRLIRPRQNLSTKLRLLAWSGIVGVLIDNAVSVYQFQNSPEVSKGTAQTADSLVGLSGRSLLYVLAFAAAVGFCGLVGSRRTSTETPPPRFGRD